LASPADRLSFFCVGAHPDDIELGVGSDATWLLAPASTRIGVFPLRHGEVERLLRLAMLPVVDILDASQRARDRIAARAELADM
jgi:LmbE family N-acetylglucosaminyl deacetylase